MNNTNDKKPALNVPDKPIDIVLAAYNGQDYIQAQIQSIQRNHGYSHLVRKLIVVDDGSSDHTLAIIQTLAANDNKIELHQPAQKKVGPSKNFARGLALTSAPFVMLSDQDDIWLPDKVVTSYQHIKALNPAQPLLVYSDLSIVDSQLNVINDSYFVYKKIPLNWGNTFSQLLQQNTVSGCTAIFNRPLLDKALPIPEAAYMHDWWLALVAKQFGTLKLIERPLMQYRQHTNNSIGAKPHRLVKVRQHYQDFCLSMDKIVAQANAFKAYFSHQVDPNALNQLTLLSDLKHLSRKQRLKAWISKKLNRSHVKARIVLLAYLLFTCK
ncbi:glycosyltransferase family 2 protein [Salinivibrio sp. ML290]|uniref:glycosyltransferase family 2 protein n=1 Tax=Salinivibrio sp. ML290 TaxID=1909468 RepID=UPI001300E840|nr:glycosyltransferase family 2 protein [Salinivibrio sp. ML290]